MSCNNSPCNDPCGCIEQIKGKCVFYQGNNLSCLDVSKGDDYDSILANLNTLICNLSVPSGIQTTLTGCRSVVITKTSDNNYNVCLNPTIENQINNNTTNISNLSACVDAGVLDIVSNDGSVIVTTDTLSSGCGRIIDISVPTPSGNSTYDGIVENNTEKSTYTNTPGFIVLRSSTFNDFILNSYLDVGDEIRFRLTGQVTGDGTNADDVIIELFNGSTSLPISSKTVSGFSLAERQSWVAEGVITVTDVVGEKGLYSLTFLSNSLANGGFTAPNSNSKILVSEDISGIDYSSLIIRVIYNHKSTSTDVNNFVRQLMVEVRKKIL